MSLISSTTFSGKWGRESTSRTIASVSTRSLSSCTFAMGRTIEATVSPSSTSIEKASSPQPTRFRNARSMRMPSPAPSVVSIGAARASTNEL